MSPGSQECPRNEALEVVVLLAVRITAHDIHHFLHTTTNARATVKRRPQASTTPQPAVIQHLRQLEAGVFEAKVATGGDSQQEPEVDVNEVALVIVHHVAVVAVLDLQDETNHGVRRKGSHQVASRRFELLAVLAAKLVLEVLVQRGEFLLADFVARGAARHDLDDATSSHGLASA